MAMMAIVGGLVPAAAAMQPDDSPPSRVEQAIVGGLLADAAKEIEAALAQTPDDNQAIFALGVVQFLQSGERLARAAHKHGASVEGNRSCNSRGCPAPRSRRGSSPRS
jgi:hypothetical protein